MVRTSLRFILQGNNDFKLESMCLPKLRLMNVFECINTCIRDRPVYYYTGQVN